RAEDGEPEERRDLEGRPARGGRVLVREPGAVRRQAGVLQALGQLRRPDGPRGLVPGDLVRGAGLAHADFAPIQTAAPMRAPMPTIHTHRPSTTGPTAPRSVPPGEP